MPCRFDELIQVLLGRTERDGDGFEMRERFRLCLACPSRARRLATLRFALFGVLFGVFLIWRGNLIPPFSRL